MLHEVHAVKADVRAGEVIDGEQQEGHVELILRTGGAASANVPHFFTLTPAMALALMSQLESAIHRLSPPAPQPHRIDPA